MSRRNKARAAVKIARKRSAALAACAMRWETTRSDALIMLASGICRDRSGVITKEVAEAMLSRGER